MPGASQPAPVIVKRQYSVSRKRVFYAFATAKALENWFSPASDIATRVDEFDFRPGGRYRISFHIPGGTWSSVAGKFVQIDPPSVLSFTWCWEEPDPHAGILTEVDIHFRDLGDTTEIVVTHSKMPTVEMQSRHTEGWAGALNRLITWLDIKNGQQLKDPK
ncbi:MAG: SRPBCC domain-containing protein [Rhodospirillales bacterium]|nr:SRPBCC domain-containing protein [Rhodospirillales bacterium]MBI2585868.1 SRPBCC domain-containing protein [Rhodospirillales bacterium]MBI2978544.1 SRPBCC domain-containing protein [Rhodospirillales bacterium]